MADVREQYLSVLNSYVVSVASGDPDRGAPHYTEDAILLLPDTQPLVGREAIKANYAATLNGGLELDVRPSDLQDYGDLLIVSGTTSGPGFSGNWLEVMKKNPAGPLPYRIYRLSFIEI